MCILHVVSPLNIACRVQPSLRGLRRRDGTQAARGCSPVTSQSIVTPKALASFVAVSISMLAFRPVSICQVCPRVRPALASSADADNSRLFLVCRRRARNVFCCMTTIVAVNTSVVNRRVSGTVDERSHDVHHVAVTTLEERLKEVMTARGISAREWCRRAGVSQSQISSLKGRGTGRGRSDVIEKLAKGAGVSLTWLASGIGSMEGRNNEGMSAGTFLLKVKKHRELEDALENDPGRWSLSTVIKALQLTMEHHFGGDPRTGWRRVLDAVENGQISDLEIQEAAGGVVTSKTQRQVGRRPLLRMRPK